MSKNNFVETRKLRESNDVSMVLISGQLSGSSADSGGRYEEQRLSYFSELYLHDNQIGPTRSLFKKSSTAVFTLLQKQSAVTKQQTDLLVFRDDRFCPSKHKSGK